MNRLRAPRAAPARETSTAPGDRPTLRPWQVALAGMVSLAVAMGIGRFAFTPLLPMMLADGVVDLPTASWLASANYLGYLIGALLCMVLPWWWARRATGTRINAPRMVRGGLVATVLLTLGMAWHWPASWPALRFAAGVASALVFVYISGWSLGQLARLGVPSMGASIYIGPGAGIALSGLAASGMVALHGTAAVGWLVFGLLAAVLTVLVWRTLHPRNDLPAAPAPAPAPRPASASRPGPAPAPVPALPPADTASGAARQTTSTATVEGGTSPSAGRGREITLLAMAYGLAGFGYIITATFLPVIARQQLPASSLWLDLFWPLFGVGVMLGAFTASRLSHGGDMRWRLVVCYLVQCLGIVVGLVEVSAPGFALGSLLLGLPFTVITYYTMQEARRLRPGQTASLMGLLTATYGLGQIVGPPLTAAVLARSSSVANGFQMALEIAAAALALGALLFVVLVRVHPLHRP
jgi:MFS family permease